MPPPVKRPRNVVRPGRKMAWSKSRDVAAYVRVSSRSQSCEMQRDAIQRAARARGDRVRFWFEEKASAGSLNRGQLSNVREKVRLGLVTKLYVYRLDRLARTGIRDTLAILEELRGAGCHVLTVADGFALDHGPTADVVIAVIAWAAQMERAARGERIASARKRIEAEGGTWGRPRRVTDAQVKKIRAMARRGMMLRDICVSVKVPRSTVAAVVSEKGAYSSASKRRQKRTGPRASE